MQYLDYDRLAELSETEFQQTHPFPWMNPAGLLTEAGYERLMNNLPRVDQMTPSFGKKRSHGQQPHDRYALEYNEALDVAQPWHDFVAELKSDAYYEFIKRMFGRGRFKFNFHWHYAPNGASVSPHCDATRKLGSHIFYLSSPETWQPEWGGDTVILDDGGRFPRKSAPKFEDFDRAYAGESIGNYSLLFQRQERSWHGVREINCPEGRYRKVFIVVINDRLRAGLRTFAGKLKGEARRDT